MHAGRKDIPHIPLIKGEFYLAKLISNGRCVPYDPDLVELARNLRNRITIQERKLWYFLREIKPRFLRQRPVIYYIADFYRPAKKMII